MKTSHLIVILLGAFLFSCDKPIEFSNENLLGKNARIIGPEGGKIEFVELAVTANVEPEVWMTLDFPVGSINSEVTIKAVRGDFYSATDLNYDESNGGTSQVIHPMLLDTFENIVGWQWRAMAGFLPNLLDFNQTVRLSFRYSKPSLNIYPNLNYPFDHYFHYEPPRLYRLLIHPSINAPIDDRAVPKYLIDNQTDWEEVDERIYELDTINQWVSIDITNFNYIYFLAGERWVLKRDEDVTMRIGIPNQQEQIRWLNKELVTDGPASLGLGQYDFFIERSKRGLMNFDGQNSYYYYGSFAGDSNSSIKQNYNRILFTIDFSENAPGEYLLNANQINIIWIKTSFNRLIDQQVFEPLENQSITLKIDQYGAFRSFVTGSISGTFTNNSNEQVPLSIDFKLRRTR